MLTAMYFAFIAFCAILMLGGAVFFTIYSVSDMVFYVKQQLRRLKFSKKVEDEA